MNLQHRLPWKINIPVIINFFLSNFQLDVFPFQTNFTRDSETKSWYPQGTVSIKLGQPMPLQFLCNLTGNILQTYIRHNKFTFFCCFHQKLISCHMLICETKKTCQTNLVLKGRLRQKSKISFVPLCDTINEELCTLMMLKDLKCNI